MVDGIFGKTPYFTPPLKEVQLAVFGMNSPLRNVDYIFHTHRHTDHFHAGYVDAYAANNTVKGVFVPRSSKQPDSYLEDLAPLIKAAGKLREPAGIPGVPERWQLEENCTVTYWPCTHLDAKSYPAVIHCGVLLELHGCRLLFAADADPGPENGQWLRELGALDAVFLTPLFLIHPCGRQIIQNAAPARTVIYHLPLEEDDTTGLRPMAQRELAEFGEILPGLTALLSPGQTLSL